MPLSVIFWVIMVFLLLLGGWRGYSDPAGRGYWGGFGIVWVLFFILGWAVFGFIVQGGPAIR